MKQIRFFFFLLLTVLVVYFLNFKQGDIPAMGKFMNPFMGFWQNGEKELLDISEVLSADELTADVTIHYDEQLIPHIFAENDYDLYFAQGYTMAYHRLWQMEFQILASEGRLSEILGEKALKFDRLKRRKGLVYGAIRSYDLAKKTPKVFNAVQAFSDGVNHRIDEMSYKEYPIEYKLLDYAPEAWSPLKSFILLKAQAESLSGSEADLENTNALILFGREKFDILFPETFDNIDPIIPQSKKWDFDPIKIDTPDVQFPQKLIVNTIEKPDPKNGSNSFAIAPSKSASGNVLLSNEMDLSLSQPAIWFAMQLSAPGINVMGVTMAGGPGIVTGFNDSIAWGETNAKRDVVDWYAITFRNNKREEYKYDDKWLKSEKIIETIKVRGGSDFLDTIVHTHYGPVVYDRNFTGNGSEINLAMKWTGHEESDELKTFYKLNRASNYDDFNEAMRYWESPATNFIFGSVSGDVAMWVSGRFPIKWKEQGKFLMDGSDSRQEWNIDIPHAHKAFVKNPTLGYVSSANQHPVDSTYPYYVYDYHYELYRNRRINDRLKYLEQVRVEDMMKLQHDNYNYRASESLPMMLDALDTGALSGHSKSAYKLLRKWDYFSDPERLAPSVYEAWWDALYDMIWDEFDNQDVALIRPHIFNTIYLMTNDSIGTYFDDVSTDQVESLNDIIIQSYEEAINQLTKWQEENGEYEWYKYKRTRVEHLLKIPAFSFDKIKIGGNKNIVNAASANHGPSWRMVVELGKNGVRAWGTYPGSQTGNPGNPGYGSFIEGWATGKYHPLNFLHSKNEKNEKLIFTQTLKAE